MGVEYPSPEDVMEEQEANKPLLVGPSFQQFETNPKESRISVNPEASGSGGFGFKYEPRPYRDKFFSYLFVATVLVTYIFGFLAIKNAESESAIEAKVQFARYDPDSGQCKPIQHAYVGSTPIHVSPSHGRRAYEKDADPVNAAAILVPVIGTLALILPVSLGVFWLLRYHTRQLVTAILCLLCIIPISVAVLASTVCLLSKDVCSQAPVSWIITSVVLGFLALLMLLQFFGMLKRRSRVDLAIQIIQTATEALKHNLYLLLVGPILSLVVVLISGPMAVFIWYAIFIGKVSPNFDAIRDPANMCDQATGAPCCEYQPAGFVFAYIMLVGIAVTWVVMVASQVKVLVVTGTIAQWYFAPAGSSTVGSTKRSLRNALGPSFGTACLSSLIITIMAMLRSLTNTEAGKLGSSILACFIRACFSWLFQIVESFTLFTNNFAAISGDSFCTSARATLNLLRRNFLSTVMVEIMAQTVLSGIVLTTAFINFGVVRAPFKPLPLGVLSSYFALGSSHRGGCMSS
uniref:Choline transporter-like protein n=1 Tax=Physcomitrium patens TaxID=3218 RepID=A0A7I4FHB9_PHYPA